MGDFSLYSTITYRNNNNRKEAISFSRRLIRFSLPLLIPRGLRSVPPSEKKSHMFITSVIDI